MNWVDLLWLPPIMLAIAMVLGTAGTEGREEIKGAIVHTFFTLTIGVLVVGAVIHVVARVFA